MEIHIVSLKACHCQPLSRASCGLHLLNVHWGTSLTQRRRLQVRGSIPLFWHQEGGGSRLKPDILLQQYDPLYGATRQHIDDLRQRYGEPACLPGCEPGCSIRLDACAEV